MNYRDNGPYISYPIVNNITFIYIHNVPVLLIWIGASNTWKNPPRLEFLSILLNIVDIEAFKNQTKQSEISLYNPIQNNSITINYNGIIQKLDIEKTCKLFHLICNPCNDNNTIQLFKKDQQSVGRVVGFTNGINKYDSFSCGNYGPLVMGGSIFLALKRKYCLS